MPLQLPPPRPGLAAPMTGEEFEIPLEEPEVLDAEDGGAFVAWDATGRQEFGEFFENLVEAFDSRVVDDVVLDLLEKVEEDKEARKDRDKLQAEGLKRTGFSDEAPGGADFTGASKVVHPMIGKAAIEFSSRLMKEIFPADGPVKDKIVGEVTGAKVEKAKRKKNHMNWQLTEQIPEFRPTLEQLLTQVPIGGAQYLKFYFDRGFKRPACEPVWIDNLLLPAAAASFLSARRRTVCLYLTEDEYRRRVANGTYVDADLKSSVIAPDETKSEKANARIEGKSSSPYNEDGLRLAYEIYVWREVPEDPYAPEGRAVPYILTIDESTMTPLGWYRNWDPQKAEERDVVEELEHVVEYAFIPWRGAYPLGLFHLIGGLAISATGSLRAMLDNAFLQNSLSGVKLKGLVRGGQSINVKPTQISELEGNINTDDVRKLFMPYPYNPTSPVLFQLLGFLTEQADSVVRTALEDAADVSANAPVGTTLARIEQGMTVFASIHGRTHSSLARSLKVLHRINRDTLEQEVINEESGELLALPEDYQGPMDVVPVSDPNIFSEMQRFGQVQVIAQRSAGNPLYKQAEVEKRILDNLKIPDAKELLDLPSDPEPTDPITENVALSFGKPATAFPNQDHVAHLITHLSYLTDEQFGLSKLIGPTLVPPMLGHVKEHLVLLYAKMVADTVSRATGTPVEELMEVDPQTQNALARAFAAAARHFHEEQVNLFQNAQAAVAAAIEFMQQLQSEQAPPDPTLAVAQLGAQVAREETARKTQADQAKATTDAEKLRQADEKQRADTTLTVEEQRRKQQADAVTAGAKRRELELEQTRLELEEKLKTLQENVKLVANREDNLTAMRIALLDLAAGAGDKTAVSTGKGLGRGANPSPGGG